MMCEILDSTGVKSRFFVSHTSCEQCNGFTREARVHNELFITAYCLKSSLVLSLDSCFPAMVELYYSFKCHCPRIFANAS